MIAREMFVPGSPYPSHLPKQLPTVRASGRHVSVAPIFKELQPQPKIKRGACKNISGVVRRKVVDARVQNLRRIKSSSNSRSPNNGLLAFERKGLGSHRLEYAFKGMSSSSSSPIFFPGIHHPYAQP